MDKSATEIQTHFETIIREIVNILTTYGLDVVGAVIILIIGLWFAGKAAKMMTRVLTKAHRIDDTLIKFFASFVKYVIMIVTVVAVLNQFGVQTASLLTVIGAAGLAIGLALQGTLSNVAAGVMLLLFRPFKAGDFVEVAGQAGTIQELNLFFTEMATPDNVRITVPNGQVWGGALKNYSANPTRRVDIVAGISYEDDIDNAMEILQGTIAKEDRVKGEPEPFVAVGELADSSVNLVVRVWVANGDYWGVKFDLTKAFKQALDENGITIPYPTRTVYTENSGS
jgi:small conductance mechanosensitive channel